MVTGLRTTLVAALLLLSQQPVLAFTGTTPVPSGSDRIAVRDMAVISLAERVNRCWSVTGVAGNPETSVLLGLELDPNGRVRNASRLGGDHGPGGQLYLAARQAVLRCQGAGYSLPADQHAAWQYLELGFGPEGMLTK